MPVTEYLERNARLYPDEVALVELNPDEPDTRRTSWKEFELIQPSRFEPYRREIISTLPSVCSQISGPVVFLCAAGFAGFSN